MDREMHRQIHRVSRRSSLKSSLDSRGRVTYCTPRFAGKKIEYTVSEDATKGEACKMKYAALLRKSIPGLNCARVESGACQKRVVITTGSKGNASHLSQSSAELDQTINPRPQYGDRKERMIDIHPLRMQSAEVNRSQPPTSYPIIKCEYCAREFAGMYARGDCWRHKRSKHGVGTGSTCLVCEQPYDREDARIEHEWEKHRLLQDAPSPRCEPAES